ncbi:bile acid:sodium symporter [Streptomyces calidiresistens]|uniref:Bile acid:sodium symporter n=2 Tax=Streptomyces calidiresistens TaxID=1485586 RepID=A0A7W3XY62_9ACTN|nr:bile acid:sodium symporter [Streptomyces calidiresistens]
MTRWLDPYLVLLMGTVALAAVLPATGPAATAADASATGAIALLFFLYGARLSTAEALAGVRHWRLHLTILACTFVLYPLLGLAARPLGDLLLTPELYAGLLFLCLVPSTVQSSIAFTSIARGNVAGAIAAGSFSSLVGVFLTPLLVVLLMGGLGGAALSGGPGADALVRIGAQLLLPFLLGQLLRRFIGGFVTRHRAVLSLVDRGSILIVVYAAFSRGMEEDIWARVSWRRLLALGAVEVLLLALMLVITVYGSRRLGFSRGDRVAIVFAGSKKSLAAGLPMAGVLFGPQAAMAVLPLMLFHQMQLVVCAVLARRWGREEEPRPVGEGPPPGPADDSGAHRAPPGNGPA